MHDAKFSLSNQTYTDCKVGLINWTAVNVTLYVWLNCIKRRVIDTTDVMNMTRSECNSYTKCLATIIKTTARLLPLYSIQLQETGLGIF